MKTITSLASLIAIGSSLFAKSASADQHFVDFYEIYNVISLTGQMEVPTKDLSGTPYLWPGLQPYNNQGVLQPVLDGRNGGWFFGNNYVGNPSGQPYGGGVSAPLGSTLSYVLRNTNDGKNNWYSEVSNEAGDKASYTYEIGQVMTQAIFDCELYDTNWDFGDVVFKNIEITASGSDLSWCNDHPYASSVNYNVQGVSSSTGDGTVSCKIEKISLSPPS